MKNFCRRISHLYSFLLVLVLLLLFPFGAVKAQEGDSKILNVRYQTHIENVGWQYMIYDGQMSGTSGQALRLEGIKISLDSSYPNVKVLYQTHIQNVGWQEWMQDGQLSGTSGRSLRLEGIRIKLQGAPVGYHIQYQVHVQNVGWQDWVEDGDMAGTLGQSLRLEGIRVRVVKEGSAIKGGQGIKYETHVENDGWQNSAFDSQLSGTQGRGLRLEGIKVSLQNPPEGMKIKYQTHVQNVGWQPWSTNGELSGTSGKAYRLEGIKIMLENAPKDYHILYQVHVQNIGWQEWKSDGAMAGTEGKSLRLEAIRIKLVRSIPGEPLIDIESPKLDEKLQNSIEIKGWSVNASKVKEVNVYLDRMLLGKANINIERLDVKEQYNLYPNSDKSGFKYKLDLTNVTDAAKATSVSSISNVTDTPKAVDASSTTNVTNAPKATEVSSITNVTDATKVTEVSGIANVTDSAKATDVSMVTSVTNTSKTTDVASATNLTDAPKATNLSTTTTVSNGFHEITIESVGEDGSRVVKKLYFRKMGQDVTITSNKLPIIAIDIGHNVSYNGGAVGIRREDDLTMEVGTKVINKLREQGYLVIETLPKTASSQKDSLQQRVATANNAKADLFVSIHFNAGGGQGSEVYIVSNEALPRAQKVLDNIVSLGYANRGVKTGDYYVIKNTNMPAMLIECAFVDSQADMQRYNAEKLANSIVNGILLK